MKFQFSIHINDQDYVDFNVFHQTKTPYYKKQFIPTMVLFIILMTLLYIVNLSANGLVGSIPALLLYLIPIVFFKKIFAWVIKIHIKSSKKRGKPGYSPESVITFFEENFVEVTPENKTETAYSAIERISVVNNNVIYIHINNIMAYILPFDCFESPSQREEFMEFIKTKCATVDVYR